MNIDEIFAASTKKRNDSRVFLVIFVLLFALLFAGLSYLSKIEALPAPVIEKLTTLKTSFSIIQEKKPQPKPIDLGDKPKVAKTETELARDVVAPSEPSKEIKKVYGLKKVYSTGLGSGGAMSGAVVGKFGNTIDKDFDTVSATQSDLAGEVVSTASVTQAPAFKKRVRPVISDEIRQSGVSGTVKVKILVDIDGKVKRAVAQNDLGFGTQKAAVDACLQMEFVPALRGEEAVAVWITIPVRFEKL